MLLFIRAKPAADFCNLFSFIKSSFRYPGSISGSGLSIVKFSLDHIRDNPPAGAFIITRVLFRFKDNFVKEQTVHSARYLAETGLKSKIPSAGLSKCLLHLRVFVYTHFSTGECGREFRRRLKRGLQRWRITLICFAVQTARFTAVIPPDLQRRTAAHNSGTSGPNTPVPDGRLFWFYYESFESKSEALKQEAALKNAHICKNRHWQTSFQEPNQPVLPAV